MAKQLFLNNFEFNFTSPVIATAITGSPTTEYNYGILEINNGAAALLTNPTGGDFYILTALTRSGSTETNIEIMKVTAVDTTTFPGHCWITVSRAQEGTTAKAYATSDWLSMRWTKGGAANMAQITDFSAPPSIGGTTPAAGSFITLTANGGVFSQKSVGYGASVNAEIVVGGIDNGFVNTGAISHWRHYVSGDANGQFLALQAFIRGAGYANYATFSNTGLAITSGGLGYGAGAGATVIQATSKLTGVTLHKATGRITTTADPLAAGAVAQFVVTCSACSITDSIVVNANASTTNCPDYQVYVYFVGNGTFGIAVKNVHATVSRSDAVVINFAIIKGSVS